MSTTDNTSSVFADVSFGHSGDSHSQQLVPWLKRTLRSRCTSKIIQWKLIDNNYDLSNNGTKLKKGPLTNWGPPLHSTEPLPTKTTYFQAKMNQLDKNNEKTQSGGFHIGIAKTNQVDLNSYFSPSQVICLFNGNADDKAVVTRYGSCSVLKGDIVGVVVDFEKDKILFYVNGKLHAVGTKKPSEMQPMYAVT